MYSPIPCVKAQFESTLTYYGLSRSYGDGEKAADLIKAAVRLSE
jgi:hypothetical protein